MADTTYRHAVEELQYSPRYYRGFSTYDLAQNDNRNLLGPISRSIFNFDSDQPRPGLDPFALRNDCSAGTGNGFVVKPLPSST